MTVAIFVTLLSAFSVVTGLVTEAAKNLFVEQGQHYAPNLMACIIGCIIGISGTACYYVLNGVAFDVSNVVCMVLMGFASSLGAMVGYDKLTQMIGQIKG